MMAMKFAKLTLFFVVLTSLATSQPFSRSHGAISRHRGFEWNTRKIGTKKVATISRRKDEERDRRSIPLTDADTTFHKSHELPSDGTREGDHQRDNPLINPNDNHNNNNNHHHRHHHGEGEAGEVEWLTHGGGGGGGRGDSEDGRGSRRNHGRKTDRHRGEDKTELRDRFAGDFTPAAELRTTGVDTSSLHEILASSGLELDSEVFKNVTAAASGRKRNEGGSRKNKNKSKKVKRDKKKRNRGRKNKSKERKKNRNNMRKCRHLKGKEKKKCRANASLATAEADTFCFINESVSMRGNEACQYHHLEECCRKVVFSGWSPENLPDVLKCNYRKEFFDCMEEQRLETCDPNFETKGDMKTLRKKIRDVIWTTNSCLISEVVEG